LQLEVALTIAQLTRFMQRPKMLDRFPSLIRLRDRVESLQTAIVESDPRTTFEVELSLFVNFVWSILNGLLNHSQPSGELASAAPYRKHIESLLRALCIYAPRARLQRLEGIVGAAAADASHWRLRALE